MAHQQDVTIPVQNALCRFCASFLTWPIEKSKLIFQAEGMPIVSRLVTIPLRHHLQGAIGELVGFMGFMLCLTS